MGVGFAGIHAHWCDHYAVFEVNIADLEGFEEGGQGGGGWVKGGTSVVEGGVVGKALRCHDGWGGRCFEIEGTHLESLECIDSYDGAADNEGE